MHPATLSVNRVIAFQQKRRKEVDDMGKRKSKAIPPFNADRYLQTAGLNRKIVKYRKRQIIFSQGEAADSIFYINEGKIKLTVLSEQGKEAVVAILGPSDFFGEGCLAGQPRRMATAVAMTECLITRLDKAAMIRELRQIALDCPVQALPPAKRREKRIGEMAADETRASDHKITAFTQEHERPLPGIARLVVGPCRVLCRIRAGWEVNTSSWIALRRSCNRLGHEHSYGS